jgi:hypothetical protein
MQPDANLSQHRNSLITGKITGNFQNSGRRWQFSIDIMPQLQMITIKIPYVTEQGISKRVSGKIFEGTGKLISKRPLFARLFCACRRRSVLTCFFAKVRRNR